MIVQYKDLKYSSDNASTINVDNNTFTKITECLTAKHEDCTGQYIDSLTGNFQIICRCKCHFNRKNRNKEK